MLTIAARCGLVFGLLVVGFGCTAEVPTAKESRELPGVLATSLVCEAHTATLAGHVTAGRATRETNSFLFFSIDAYTAAGTGEELGSDGAASVTLYERADGGFTRSEVPCPNEGGGLFGGWEDLFGSPGGGTGSSGSSCLRGSGDFRQRGPYRTARRDVTIGAQGAYTIFYPNPLDADCPHPIVAWGNGTFVTGAEVYGFYQEHAASWGMVVIASHNSNVGNGEFHRAGIDYLLRENGNPASPFYGRLSTRAGTSGHSQGGAGADRGAAHPNVEAVVNVQGSFGGPPAGAAFLCLTGTADIAPLGCSLSVSAARTPAMLANWEGGDHVGTATLLGALLGDPGTAQYTRLYSAWFRCFLDDDQQACAMFRGAADCPVCREPGWNEIYSKNL